MSRKRNNTIGVDTDSQSLEDVLTVFRSILPEKSAIYVATPITTGRQFYENKHESTIGTFPDCVPHDSRQVVLANRDRVRPIINRLREQLKEPLIDPTQVEFRHWSQSEYTNLWRRVIEQFVYKIVFLNGWEYSTGCIQEFLVGCEERLMMFDEQLKVVTMASGKRLIESALDELHRAGHDSPVHRQAIERLTTKLEPRSSV
jgi:hypothetical protein